MDTDTDNKATLAEPESHQDEGRLDPVRPIGDIMEEHFDRLHQEGREHLGGQYDPPEPVQFLGNFDLPDLEHDEELILVKVRVKRGASDKLRTTSVVRYQTGQLEVGFKIPPEAEVQVETWKSEHDDRLGVALLVPLTL